MSANENTDQGATPEPRANGNQRPGVLPNIDGIPDVRRFGGAAQGSATEGASSGPPTLHDDRTRRFRLFIAGAGVVALAGLWLALACLRDDALHRAPSQAPVGSGLASGSIHPHQPPSYTFLFLLLSYSVVIAGIAFSMHAHDPYGARLRVNRKRVERAIKDYDAAFKQRVLDPLNIEQPHRDLVGLASDRLEVIRQRSARKTRPGTPA
jgi:hypothetical protein